ncbi:unnamed protein product [Amaranthus hypochondriacus]
MASTASTEKTTKCELPNPLSLFPVIVPPFSPHQFFFKPISTVSIEVLHNLQKSISSIVEKCLQSLQLRRPPNANFRIHYHCFQLWFPLKFRIHYHWILMGR